MPKISCNKKRYNAQLQKNTVMITYNKQHENNSFRTTKNHAKKHLKKHHAND